jgi:protein-disulfide isomerase
MEQNKHIIPLAIVAAGAMIAGAVYFGGSSDGNFASATKSNPGTTSQINIDKVTDKDWVKGNRNAAVFIIEYSDIECPFCKIFHSTMKDVMGAYDGEVARVFRHFPIAQLHKNALKEAEATECAAEQGGNTAFWTYLDKLFEATNSNDSLDLAELPQIASSMGLDVAAFNACLSSGKHVEKIQKQIESAVKAGARGTPYAVIIGKNGKKDVINGAEPLPQIKAKIDAMLK